jgi:flagellar protein FlgJ
MLPKDFIAQLSDPAKELAKTSKIPASFTVAQAAIESGWGAHAPGNNLFGIKATTDWKGAVIMLPTKEFLKGVEVTVQASFRAYLTWAGSLQDHAQFLLLNERYKPAFATTNAFDFAKAIQAAGYSSSPTYAQDIINSINAHSLLVLDV